MDDMAASPSALELAVQQDKPGVLRARDIHGAVPQREARGLFEHGRYPRALSTE